MLIDFEEGKKVGFRMEMVEKDSDEGKKIGFGMKRILKKEKKRLGLE